jgi:hypothetical protein
MLMHPIARRLGYALAIHGSVNRDMDLIAVPWTEKAVSGQELINAFEAELHLEPYAMTNTPNKPHGRWAHLLALDAGLYIDISVMPRLPQPTNQGA